MIPVSADGLQPNQIKAVKINSQSWQSQLANAFKSADTLLSYLDIDPKQLGFATHYDANFPLKVPLAFANLMTQGDGNDPLLKQVLTTEAELIHTQEYLIDPLQEASFTPTPGLIHKYANRALLIAHQSCAVHCRYCFRRHFPYDKQQLRKPELAMALDYLKNHPAINEIILSGGDPLSLSDAKLKTLIDALDTIPNLTTIRIHSRTPVVLPDRITAGLVDLLANTTKKIVIVLHINHANEIGEPLAHKLQLLKNSGVTLLNQSVLLRGINDDTDTLTELSEQLWRHGALPYYLHLLDPVQNAAHFNVDEATANHLWQQMQSRISGYLLPRLVREIPAKPSKTWVNRR